MWYYLIKKINLLKRKIESFVYIDWLRVESESAVDHDRPIGVAGKLCRIDGLFVQVTCEVAGREIQLACKRRCAG